MQAKSGDQTAPAVYRVSIILPVLDEGAGLGATLQSLQRFRHDPARPVEIIVVDGGSRDDTVQVATAAGVRVISAPRGRSSQMNAGAAAASGDVLFFLHADTVLPDDALGEIARALAVGSRWGRFDVHIDGRSRWLPIIAALMNRRSRLTGIATGDQAIFVRRAAFEGAGHFPAIPLMEDIALSQTLRRGGRPYCSRSKVITSGRRWEKHGVLRTILLMWRLRLRYFFGADPQRLAADYGYGVAKEVGPDTSGAGLAFPGEPAASGNFDPSAPIGVAILAKAPLPGYAKTRLIPLLGDAGAARLQDWLLRRSVNTALAAGVGPVTLWCAPDAEHPVFRACAGLGPLKLRVQPAGDLGQRMLFAAQSAAQFGTNTAGTLIIGTDCPALSPATLQSAAQTLRQGREAVLIPAEDGGYVLIGLRTPQAGVFAGIDWGTATVLAATRQRLQELGLSWAELPPLWDVDLPADYQRLLAAAPEVASHLAARSAVAG